MGVELRQRYNFAVQHMLTAARYARLCHEVELDNKGAQFGPFFDEIRSHASASVLFSVAALEANINETFADVDDGQIPFKKIDSEVMEEVWGLIEEKPILEKYQYALVLQGKERMNRGRKDHQFVDTLVKVRNALMHYKPEWHDEMQEHEKISKRLRGKFELSPFLDSNAPVFPMRCMCHSFAEWAVKSVLDFVEFFSTKADVPNRFDQFDDRLGTTNQ